MLKVAQIKHPYTSVCANTGKHIPPTSSFTESNVIHLFVMGNQLGLHMARYHIHASQHLARLESPHSAGGVNTGCSQQIGVHLIPVERREGSTEIRVLVVVQQALQLCL